MLYCRLYNLPVDITLTKSKLFLKIFEIELKAVP